MRRIDYTVEKLNNGLGFGEGAISGLADNPEVLRAVDDVIEHHSNLLVPIDCESDGRQIDDDGCGDGREAGLVFRASQTFNRSLNRAKIFGGAVVMTVAGKIGLGESSSSDLNAVFEESIDDLENSGIDFGAHTDEYECSKNCGCGAIDKAPAVIAAIPKYAENIEAAIDNLGLDTDGLDEVIAGYENYAEVLPDQPDFSGQRVMQRIIGAKKVVKRLSGEHRERRIILNTVRDHTVDQSLVRRATNDRAQVFAVDLWRLEDIAKQLHPDDDTAARKAFLGGVVYTLGVSAVLTKGDLPVYLIQGAEQKQPQPA